MIEKPHKPIIEHPLYSEIIILLSIENSNTNSLAKKLNKAQSGIYLQFQYLLKNKWIRKLKKSDDSSPVNYDKLSQEFIKYFLDNFSQKEIEKYKINVDLIIKEEFYQRLLRSFLKTYAKQTEKNKTIVLKDVFQDIRDILRFWSNREALKTLFYRKILRIVTPEQLAKINQELEIYDVNDDFSKNYPASYKFMLLITNILDEDSFIKKISVVDTKKMKLSIKKAKIWKTGNSTVITIPPYLIQNHLKVGEEYDFEVEVEE